MNRVLFGATFIPFLLFMSFGVVNNLIEARRHAETLHEEIVSNTSKIIDNYLELLQTEMLLAAGKIISLEEEFSVRLLNSLMSFNHAFETLSLADMEGKEIAKVGRYTLFTRDDLDTIRHTFAFSEAVKNQKYLSLVRINQFNEPYIRMSLLISDIRRNDIGVMTADISLKYLWDVIAGINTEFGGYAYVVDNRGRLIAYKDSSVVLQGRTLMEIKGVENAVNSGITTTRYIGLKGDKVIGSYHQNIRAEWFVIVESPLKEVMGNVHKTIYFGLIVSIIIIILNTLFVRSTSGKIVKPIIALKGSVSRFGSGDFTHEIEISSNDEIGDLTKTFNDMAVQLNNAKHEFRLQLKELKKTANSLQASEDKFSKAFFTSSDSISITSIDPGVFIELNKGFENIFGYKREEILGTSILDLGIWKNPEDRKKMVELLKSEGRILGFQAIGIRKSGEEFIGIISVEVIIVDDTKCLLTTVRDITEEKKSEELLERSERNYREIFNSGSDAILIQDFNTGEVQDVNNVMLKMYGYEKDEILHEEMGFGSSGVKPYTREFALQKIAEVKKRGSVVFEWQAKRKDGVFFWVEVSLKASEINDRKIIIAIIRDISERKKLHQTLIQSEKMLSLGGLAAGMAHEINNPLAGILQNAQAVINRIEKDSPANIETAERLGINLDAMRSFLVERKIINQLNHIHEAGKRASKIVSNMLSFARKDDKKSSHNILNLLDETVEMAGSDYNLRKKYDFRSIRIIRSYRDERILVPCNPGHIQQVFFNILKNGAEAMFEKDSKDNKISAQFDLTVQKKKHRVRIEIKNNVTGIPFAQQSRIFEPFYTTKEVGVGTGLGLSVSYFIVCETHHGDLRVESDGESWANFIIELPVDM